MTGLESDRRKFLAATGTALTIAVAGCSGGDDDDDDNGDDGDDLPDDLPEEVDSWFEDEDGNTEYGYEDLTGEDSVTITNGPGGDFAFDPAVVRVSTGTTVTWEWDSDGHSVESEQTPGEEFDSGTLDEGSTFDQTFDEAGNVLYFCFPHRANGHVGAVIVECRSRRL